MGYKMTENKKVQRTTFPKKLTKEQIEQMDNAKSKTATISRAVAATKRVKFSRLEKSV